MDKRDRNILLGLLVITFVLINIFAINQLTGRVVCPICPECEECKVCEENSPEYAIVTRIVDGDTLATMVSSIVSLVLLHSHR